MPVQCAKCSCFVCRAGRTDAAPEDCPMLGDFPQLEELYSSDEKRRLAYHAAVVEALGYSHWTRLREISELAGRLGISRVGVAHCPDMAREAGLAADYLRDQQLDVRLPPEGVGCDPLGQAQLFASQDTQLNVIAGMCVGHEALFTRASHALVTVLVARDERLRHNPVAALYTADSYSHDDLYGRGGGREALPFRGSSDEMLAAASDDLLSSKQEPWCRVRETMEFAYRLGVSHIGLSFCVGFRAEARLLTRVLEANGFRVTSICCKSGAVPKEEIGIEENQKVRPGEAEMICNPVAQAEILNREGVQLALVLGQCVGHDSATLAQIDAPVVCVVAKDRVLAHNTVAALYQLEG